VNIAALSITKRYFFLAAAGFAAVPPQIYDPLLGKGPQRTAFLALFFARFLCVEFE
jgi:hypothetical protein